MNLFIRTLKAFSRTEKIICALLFGLFIGSFYSIFFTDDGIGFELGGQTTAIYSEGLVGEIIHLNPLFTEFSEADRDISSLIFSGLAKYNAQTGDFEEDIATHTLDTEQLVYTFTLKNGVTWHDGVEVTAEDIYFTFHDVIQSDDFSNPILKSNFEGVEIEKVDSRTVTFTINTPNSFFFSGLIVGILPQHILKDVPVSDLDTHEFNKQPIGTGPYQVQTPYSFNEDGSTSIDLVAFPQFYGEIPKLQNLRLIAYPDITELVSNRSVWNGAARVRASLLDEIDLKDIITYQYELPQYTALFFNTDSSTLSKNKVRLGISKGIDKKEILEIIGYKVEIDTPLLELNQDEWIHVYNLEDAQGALFDTGWGLDEGDEFRTNSDGETLTLRLVRRDFSTANPTQEETTRLTAEVIQRQLADLGIEIIVEAYDFDELQDIIQERDYDILLYGQSLGYNLDTFAYWHSSQAGKNGLNLSNYQNPKADFQIENIRGTFDPEERAGYLNSLAEIISGDVPAVFLYTPSYYYLIDTRVTGVDFKKLLLPKDRFSNIASWILN